MATKLSCDLDCMLRSFFDSVETRRVGIAGFAVLIWDHLITLDDEIEYVWKSDRKHYFFYLFLLNRYLIPLSFVVNLYAYCSHTFDYNSCRSFVAYEGILTMVGIAISNLMMLYRVNALCRGPSTHSRRCHPVVFGLGTLLLVFVCVNTWLFFSAQPIFVRSQHVHSCTMIFDPSLPGAVTSSTAWLPLIYDTTVVGLTVYRTLPYGTDHIATTTRRLLRQGLLYYSVIFSVTLTLTVMILAAPPGTKNIAAQLELLLTATMMSRITLDLKRFARAGTASDTQGYFRSPAASGHLPVPGPPPAAAPPSLPAPMLHGARDARDAIELVRKEHKMGSMIVDVEEEWIEHSSAAQV